MRGGKIKVLVAKASLALGIDIGHVDLVCQISSPHRIATLLQRVGRSGHTVRGVPKGRVFPLTRDDLIECAAMLQGVRGGELDRVAIPDAPLDVLAQQIVAETAAQEKWEEDALLCLVRGAFPYRNLEPSDFKDVVEMLSRGYATRNGRRGALIHYDSIERQLRARKGSRMSAILNGGAIPEVFDYRVLLEPEGHFLGTLNEDFAIESLPGDVFQLGNTSWRILRIGNGVVRVADAQGQPPSMPFWLGEAPSRSDEMTAAVSRLRAGADALLPGPDVPRREGELGAAIDFLFGHYFLPACAAEQIAAYLGEGKRALGAVPTTQTLVLERFFDESGGMQLVLHAPFGSRINRAWGLALRKKFCQGFNFELQAAATEEGVILSLGASHSFALQEVFRYLHPNSVRETLVQAVLDSPIFETRWRWTTTLALAERRARAVYARRATEVRSADDLGALDPAAIQRVREEAWPVASTADELYDALMVAGYLLDEEITPRWRELLGELGPRAVKQDGRWHAVERKGDAAEQLQASRMEVLGPIAEKENSMLLKLERQGRILRGRFTPGTIELEWCDRRLLARIHRYTLNRLRSEIEPVAAADFMRFLLHWQHVAAGEQLKGAEGLAAIVEQLEGFELAAAAWEHDVLPARVSDYGAEQIDRLCLSGRVAWGRLTPGEGKVPLRSSPIALMLRQHVLAAGESEAPVSAEARSVREVLKSRGALFFNELEIGRAHV